MSPNTVALFERGDALQEKTITKLCDALKRAGIIFIPENGGGPGVRLAKRRRQRSQR